jgi:hypothetical protein
MMRKSLVWAVACLALGLAGWGASSAGSLAPPAQASQAAPVRILLLGDSVTQGSDGDWTWRYRLWQHFREADVAVDFVGPATDLLDRATSTYGHHGYLEPAFDQDHAARWGNAIGFPSFSVSDLVATYQPDVVVELLGVNDFNGLGASVDTVDQELGQLVADARGQKPDVYLVLGGLGSDWIQNVPEFNDQLPDLAAQLDTPASRVVAADPPHLVQGVDTYEFVHPSATGEVKIAANIADALSGLGIGPPATRPLPVVPNGPRDPAALTLIPGDGEVALSWTLPLGADRVYVEQRDLDATDPSWQRVADPVVRPQLGTVVDGLVDGDRYGFRVRAAKGTAVAEDVVSAEAEVRPGVPLAVPGLQVTPHRQGLRATWGRTGLATSYRLSWWPVGQPGRIASTVRTPLAGRVSGLLPGHRYVVAVRGLRGAVEGPSSRVTITLQP